VTPNNDGVLNGGLVSKERKTLSVLKYKTGYLGLSTITDRDRVRERWKRLDEKILNIRPSDLKTHFAILIKLFL